MKITTKQIRQMIVEELRSLMEQEESYEGLLDAMEKESKEGAISYYWRTPSFGKLWKLLMKKHVESAVPNMMAYVIKTVIGNWSDLAPKPGDSGWNAAAAVDELELYLENDKTALEDLNNPKRRHFEFNQDFSSNFRKEHFDDFDYQSVFKKVGADIKERFPNVRKIRGSEVVPYMEGWRRHLPDLVPEYYDFMKAIVEVVPMAIEEPEGMLADLLLSGEPDSVIQALELFGAL